MFVLAFWRKLCRCRNPKLRTSQPAKSLSTDKLAAISKSCQVVQADDGRSHHALLAKGDRPRGSQPEIEDSALRPENTLKTPSDVSDAPRVFALQVVQQLRDAGFDALWAGGCVRDCLMGNAPTDYDVATSATPEQVRRVFGKRRTLPVGISFGVIIVLGPKSAGQVEVATFRTDSTYSDGRHPDSVVFSTPREDAQRRDFTINGMFLDPVQNQVLDYVGGQFDLQQQLIRAIGKADDRIAEDKLRMLRAVRFAARFGFAIEPETRSAVARHAAEVQMVSSERIQIEVRKTLETPLAKWAVDQWSELGLLPHILPDLAAHWTSVSANAGLLLPHLSENDWLGRLAGLYWLTLREHSNITYAERVQAYISAVKARLKLSNVDYERLRFTLLAQPILEQAEGKSWSDVQPTLSAAHANDAWRLFAARAVRGDTTASEPSNQCEPLDLQSTASWLKNRMELSATELDPPPLLSGADLIAAGMQPGPQFRELIELARRLQLDGVLVDRPAALRWLEQQK